MRNLAKLKSEIQDKVEFLRSNLSTGNLKSYEEYKFLCGQIKAYTEILDEIKHQQSILDDDDY